MSGKIGTQGLRQASQTAAASTVSDTQKTATDAVDDVLKNLLSNADKGASPFGQISHQIYTGSGDRRFSHKDAAMVPLKGNVSDELLQATADELKNRGFDVVKTYRDSFGEDGIVVFRDPEFWPSIRREPGLVDKALRFLHDKTLATSFVSDMD